MPTGTTAAGGSWPCGRWRSPGRWCSTTPRRVRVVFEELLAGNINLGRLEHVEVIFGSKVTRATPGTFSTRLLNRGGQVTINLSFKHSRIKIYLNYLQP
jgi:hypothetical protein